MLDAKLGTAVLEVFGDVAGSVVGEHTLGPDPQFCEPGDSAPQELDSTCGLLVRQDLDVSNSAVVVDANVHELPPRSPRSSDAITFDLLAYLPEATELLDVQVEHLSGPSTLVAIRWLLGLEDLELVESEPFQDG